MVRSMCIGLGMYCLVVGVPYFLLWRSYKKALPSFVSAQDEVVVTAQWGKQKRWTVALALFGLGLLVLAAGIAWMVRVK